MFACFPSVSLLKVSTISWVSGVVHGASEMRFFIDSSKISLEIILLHNGNKYAFVPAAHSIHFRERKEILKFF